jgi:hypothetical protein
MKSAREQLLHHFPLGAPVREPEDELANSLYSLLWSVDEKDMFVDGWSYFRVVRESEDSIDAVGLMTLLPSGSVPIEIHVRRQEAGLFWLVQIARLDPDWLALSDSKRWNSVYLYATGEREIPRWTWGRQHHGSLHRADA